MKRIPQRPSNLRRCSKSCLYFLAEETDSDNDSNDMYDLHIVSTLVSNLDCYFTSIYL